MDPFEIVILKLERSKSTDLLYKVRDWLNEQHGEGQGMRFIVIPDTLHDTYYLSFRTSSLEEADRFRTLARDQFNVWWGERHPEIARRLEEASRKSP